MVATFSELLTRYDRPGPRYTSYPPVPRWSNGPAPEAWSRLFEGLDRPTALYVHVPFCRQQCTYCGCNMVVSRRQTAGDRYLDAIERQVAQIPPLALSWVHLGGGTPTWLDPAQIERLFSLVDRAGRRLPGAEISVEIDPMVTDEGRLEARVKAGVSRLSLGVQSLDPVVLEAVNRPQCRDAIGQLIGRARELGIAEFNLDVMTGLPHQTPERLRNTLRQLLEWEPDRLSVFGYAHVPWLKRHQQRLDADALPNPQERAELRLVAHEVLVEAGFLAIGFDHYARPDDALGRASQSGTIGRNFMGYTPYAGLPVIALGPSAISEVDGHFVQLETHLGRWWKAIEAGEVPVVRSYTSSDDDRLNGAIIEAVLCRGEVREADIVERFGRLPGTWATSLDRLETLVQDGLVELERGRVTVTEEGRFFLRVVAMAFDPALAQEAGPGRYSQTV